MEKLPMTDKPAQKATKRLPKGQRKHIRRMKSAARKEITIVKVKKSKEVVAKIEPVENLEQEVAIKPVKKKAAVDPAKVKVKAKDQKPQK